MDYCSVIARAPSARTFELKILHTRQGVGGSLVDGVLGSKAP